MNANKEVVFWRSNKAWFKRIEEIPYFELTEQAPERAVKSFEMWKVYNGITEKCEK